MNWMLEAWKDLGIAEVAGPGANPDIVGWFDQVGRGDIKSDEVANCAAWVGKILVATGFRDLVFSIPAHKRLLARSFASIGAPCELREGAIVVLKRDSGGPTAGHVGFALSWTETTVTLLNANVGDRVCVTTFRRADIIAVRWPEFTDAAEEEATTAPPQAKPEPVAAELERPTLSRPWWELLAISRTIRGALHTALGGLILFFQSTLEFALDTAAKVQEFAPLKGVLAEAGANVSAIGFGFVVWGATWVAIAKFTPKPKPARPS